MSSAQAHRDAPHGGAQSRPRERPPRPQPAPGRRLLPGGELRRQESSPRHSLTAPAAPGQGEAVLAALTPHVPQSSGGLPAAARTVRPPPTPPPTGSGALGQGLRRVFPLGAAPVPGPLPRRPSGPTWPWRELGAENSPAHGAPRGPRSRAPGPRRGDPTAEGGDGAQTGERFGKQPGRVCRPRPRPPAHDPGPARPIPSSADRAEAGVQGLTGISPTHHRSHRGPGRRSAPSARLTLRGRSSPVRCPEPRPPRPAAGGRCSPT